MAFRRAPYCSDEELLNELKKLGYNDVAPDVFQMMKEDLSGLVGEEPYSSEFAYRPERTLSSSTFVKYSGTHNKSDESKGKYNGNLKSKVSQEAKISADQKISSGSSLKDNLEIEDDRYSKYRNRLNAFKLSAYARKEAESISNENIEVDSPRIDSEPSKSLSLARKYVRLQRKYVLSGTLPDIIIARERNLDQKLGNDSTSSSASLVEDPLCISAKEDPLRKYRRFFKPRVQKSDILEKSKEFSRSFENSLLSSSAALTENKIKSYGRSSDVLEENEISGSSESNRLSGSAALPESKVNKYGKRSDNLKRSESEELCQPFESGRLSNSAAVTRNKTKTYSKRSDVLVESEELSRPFEGSALSGSAVSSENKVKKYVKRFDDLEESDSEREEFSRPYESGRLASSAALPENRKTYGKRCDVLEESEDISQPYESSLLSSSAALTDSKVKTYGRKSAVLEGSEELSQPSESSLLSSSSALAEKKSFGKRSNVLEESEELSQPSESSLLTSSAALTENKMKRKVLRHKDGKPVITEELVDIPSIFNTSYPETENLENSKSFSSDDLSYKSNGSTGSINAMSPENHSVVQSSYSTPRSLHVRIANQRKKKHDPVTMYNYYKQYWNNFKPPGEKTHDKLRWAVRDRMLDYNL